MGVRVGLRPSGVDHNVGVGLVTVSIDDSYELWIQAYNQGLLSG